MYAQSPKSWMIMTHAEGWNSGSIYHKQKYDIADSFEDILWG